MSPLSQHPRYSEEQISRYLEHIGLPQPGSLSLTSIKKEIASDSLRWLTKLQRRQMARVPFENLVLHYSTHHSVILERDVLFEKMVVRGKGGYCMENNLFFATILRTLGYTVLSTGARVSKAVSAGQADGSYTGFSHMVNIVTIDGKRYHVDVGFGSNGPTHPLPLVDGEVSLGIAPEEMRLLWTSIAQHSDPSQRVWVFQHRNDGQSPWQDGYCFTEVEFFPADYEVMNFTTSQSRTSWFTYRIACVKLVLEVKDNVEEPVGVVILVGNEVKRRIGGKTEHLATCRTEDERVAALEKWLDIRLSSEERAGIIGMVTQLTEG